jgi:DNA repair protein RAD50
VSRSWRAPVIGSNPPPPPTRPLALPPQIAGTSEVKAQIKLKFKNRVPQTLVCVRNFQLSQARTGKLQYKALDSALIGYAVNAATGQKTPVQQSNKCAAMDEMMPGLLDVPRPILEHVVFWCVRRPPDTAQR